MSVKIHVLNTDSYVKPHVHGTHAKTLMVLHETVSGDIPGLADIEQTEAYLAKLDYGIHGMTDLEGHMAWALGLGNAIFWQAGGVNDISVGIEQVSYIPALIQQKKITSAQGLKMWKARDKQLHATAKLIAAWHYADKKNHVIQYVDGSGKFKGVTTHWDVSQFHTESEGHWDCKPAQKGGHYPVLEVIEFAKVYAKLGYHF